jgi:hypothetical protein
LVVPYPVFPSAQRILALAAVLLAAIPVVAAEPVTLPARERFHLYLLIGQSNMAGRGRVEAEDKIPHPRVLMFTKAEEWVPAVDPLHFDKRSAAVGLGSTFGRVTADANPEVTIGLIPAAVSGTPLERWRKGGDLYEQAVARAKAALKDGTLEGILWHQGESDTGDATLARTYRSRLAGMVRDLRDELGAGDVPFIAGLLGDFIGEAASMDGESVWWPQKPIYWSVVNEQIAGLPAEVPRSAVVSADALTAFDGVHFDGPSLREFGRRYAKALADLNR